MTASHRATIGFGFLVALAPFACGSPAVPDGGTDALADAIGDAADDTVTDIPVPRCPMDFTLVPGDPAGHSEPLGAAPGEVRAGRLNAAQLPADRTGLAIWAAGDIVLANERVGFVIEAARPSHLYDPWGGKIVGIARVSGGRLVDAADFEEATVAIGRHTVRTTSVGVLRDGRAGGPAIVRAIGNLAPVPFLDEFARPIVPQSFTDLRVALDYELAPGSDTLEIYMTFDVTRPRGVSVPFPMHTFFQRYRMPRFRPDVGFGNSQLATPYVAHVDDTGISYAWFAGDSMLTPFISESGFDAYSTLPFQLEGCMQVRRRMGRVVAGGPGLDGMLQAVARSQSQMQREIAGRVTHSDGSPAANVHVFAALPSGTFVTRTTTGVDGRYALHVASGAAVRVSSFRQGYAVAGPLDVAATQATADLQFASVGTIAVNATDQTDGLGFPVRVQVYTTGSARPPSLPASHGEPLPGGNWLHIEFTADGRLSLPAPPGRYRVVVSHGPEYEVFDQEVTVIAGETVAVRADLRHSVDTTGIQCGDFHIHTNRSPDAEDPARLKVLSAAADGLEVAVRSEHEFVVDFEPVIAELNVGRWVYGVGSIELTTFTWGHFGVVPLAPDPTAVNGGAFEWANLLPPAVFATARSRSTAPIVIINHPRGGPPRSSYFEAAGYDPATGRVARPEMWDDRFGVVEVFNESDFEANRNGTVRDWLSFLDRGRRVFAVGSSDSHGILPTAPVGYPRTCMYLGTDNPRMLTPTAVRDAIAQGRAYVSGGIHLEVRGPGAVGPGQEAMGVGAMAQLDIVVRAASWVPVARLEVIVDGRTLETRTIDASMRDPMNPTVRLRGTAMVPVAAAGSYAIVAVHGDADLAPVQPGDRAFAASNPIFLRR